MGIQFKGSGIPSTIVITETKFDANTGIRNPVPVSPNPQRGIQKTGVVHYSLEQTRRSTVWANGKQKSGLVFKTFVQESPLPFVKFSSIYQKRLQKPETGIEDGLKKWNTILRLERSVRKNRTTFSDVPLERPEKSCSIYYFPTGFSRRLR